MKKIIAATTLALLAGSATAAGVVITSGDTVLTATCAYIPASNTAGVKLSTSANVAAAYECTSTGVVTGAAHTQGKKHAYLSTSAGGSQSQVDLATNPADTSADVSAAAGSSWTDLVDALT